MVLKNRGLKMDKEWRTALRLAVHEIHQDGISPKKQKALRLIARKVVDMAINAAVTRTVEVLKEDEMAKADELLGMSAARAALPQCRFAPSLTCISPAAWLTNVLSRIADHKITKLDELLPWRYAGARIRCSNGGAIEGASMAALTGAPKTGCRGRPHFSPARLFHLTVKMENREIVVPRLPRLMLAF